MLFSRRIASIEILSICSVTMMALPLFLANAAPAAGAFGDWTDPVPISNEEMFYGDVSEFGIYKYGLVNMTYSGDFGATWAPEKAMGGRIEVVGAVIHRVSGSPLVYDRSFDNGTSWSAPFGLGLYHLEFYGIWMLNGSLFVFGMDIDSNIAMRTSSDGGSTWSSVITVVSKPNGLDGAPSPVFKGGTVFLAFEYYVHGGWFEVGIIHSHNMGLTWEGEQTLAPGIVPQLVEDGGKLYLTYIYRFSMINFTCSADGTNWSAPVTVARVGAFSTIEYDYALAVSEGRIAVAFTKFTNLITATYGVHVNYSADDGSSWNSLNIDLGVYAGDTKLPSVYIIGDKLHLFCVPMGIPLDYSFGAVRLSTVHYPTIHLAMDLSQTPIPEFGSFLFPVIGILSLILAAVMTRKRRSSGFVET